jgi:hypothetical protein
MVERCIVTEPGYQRCPPAPPGDWKVIAVVLLIPLLVILVILAASVLATDSRDGRDWSSPTIDQHGYHIGGRPQQQCCA